MADSAKSDKPKQKRTVRPIYVVFRVKDDSGNVLPLTKENVEIVGTYKDSDELLDMLDSGLESGCFYKRIALG